MGNFALPACVRVPGDPASVDTVALRRVPGMVGHGSVRRGEGSGHI